MDYPDGIYGNCVPHINTGELRDAERVKRLLAAPDIHVAYLLGDGHFWIDYALAQPNIKLIIVRKWNPFGFPQAHEQDIDGQLHQLKTSQEVFNHFLQSGHGKYKNNPRVRWIWGWNEPTHNKADAVKSLGQLNNWQAAVVELFASNGYGAALGGYAVAKTNSLPTSQALLQTWIPIFKVLAKYPDLLHLDIHEYECAFLPINYLRNIDTAFPFSFLDKRIVNSANWGNIPYSGDGIHNNWKLGNFAEIFEYNKSLGYPPIKFGRGEWGTDTMTESWWWNNAIGSNPPLEQTWRAKFGVAPKGLHTLFKYYAYLHDKLNIWTMAEHNAFIIKQAAWFKANSGANCLYNAWYAWNTNSLWRTEDISHPDYIPFIEWMQTGQHTVKPLGVPDTTPLPIPTPVPPVTVPKRIRAKVDALRIRRTAMLTGDILGYLPRTYTDVRYALSTVDSTTDNYKWRYVEITLPDSDNVVAGYVADSLIEVEPDAIELTALEKDLVLAYRADDTQAILAILANPQLITVTEGESALLAAYRLKDIKALLQWISDLLP